MKKSRRTGFWKDQVAGYIFLAPFLLMFIMFIVIPVLQAAYTSLTYNNLIQKPHFIGLSNYRTLFTEDDVFITALVNTLTFAFIVGPAGYMISFIMAWAINMFRARSVFSLALYIPSITSGVAMSAVWLYAFSNDRYGFINNILYNIGLINTPVLWLSNVRLILPVIMVISLWMSLGNGFLVFLAGLRNVPTDLLEAGRIDGVKSRLQELFTIILPTMKPQLLFGAVNSIVGSFAVFEITVVVAGMPSPNYAAHTIVAHMFDQAFIRFDMGYASAIAMFLFAFTFVLSRIFMRILSDND